MYTIRKAGPDTEILDPAGIVVFRVARGHDEDVQNLTDVLNRSLERENSQ